MRIYPSTKKIEEKENIKRGDIPLAKLRYKDILSGANIKQRAKISNSEKRIRPYQRFPNLDSIGFDSSGNIKKLSEFMIREDDKYYYVPESLIEFRPLFLDFKVLIQNRSEYDLFKRYPITMSVIDKEDKIIESAMNIFSSGLNDHKLPNNIYINKGQSTKSSYINNNLEDTHWVIIESSDGTHYTSGEVIDFKEYEEHNTNVWLLVEPQKVYYPEDIIIDSNVIFNSQKHRLSDIRKVDSENYFDNASCIGIQKNDKNTIITTDISFFVYENIKLIYEIIMNPILQGPILSKSYSTWVTNETVDFKTNKDGRHGQTSEVFQIEDILNNIGLPIEGYDSIKIIKNEEKIKEKITDKIIIFKYDSESKDPQKPSGTESYYTYRGTVVYYPPENIKEIEKPIDLFVYKEGGKQYLKASTGKSSRLGFSIKEEKRFLLKDTQPLFLTAKNESMYLIKQEEYKEEHGVLLFEIYPYVSKARELTDIRIKGGGAKFPEEEDQPLMDINHLFGKPYRREGSLVIELPEKYESLHDEIVEEIKKYNIANEYVILNFKKGSHKPHP